MKINIGSKNPIKIEAVKEVMANYGSFSVAEISVFEVSSSVNEQPKSIEETVNGAINRAKECFNVCDYSFGIESGLIVVPQAKGGHMELTVCAIFDGKNLHFGISPAFECPLQLTNLVIKKRINLSQTCYDLGLTSNPNLGSSEGIVGVLTKGRVTRKDYTKQAITMAMIHVENPYHEP